MNASATARYSITLPVSQQAAFDYHARPGALQRLLPPWQNVEIESSDNSLTEGSRVVLRMRVGGLPVRWVAQHTAYDPPNAFEDVQLEGPFEHWHHRHEFTALGEDRCELIDSLTYKIPGGSIGERIGERRIRDQLDQMFAFRQATILGDLQLAAAHPLPSQRIALSGSRGLVGSHLQNLLTVLGHQVRPIVRKASGGDEEEIAVWADDAPLEKLREIDAVIHLAGKPIAAERWSESVKREIRESRVRKTRQLCERLAKLDGEGPRTLLCASATGYYGDRGDELLTEESAAGEGFLAEVAREWEQACQPAVEAGIRVVHLRFGVILSPRDGALPKMLTPTRLGLGGKLGRGDQWWSWIALDDCLGAIYHALARESVQGPVNVVAPTPVRNREFAQTLARVLSRPAVLPAPKTALRLMLGEMADALLLASARVQPARLEQTNYRFRYPALEPALRHLLGRAVVDTSG
ncbi:TIGR01777 family oxidoreductase [Candidatus Laterigemmans baculatus]|uniref:TIGR01777 family oxidoreductase n=1 Tax=Candidatus Laterigemmans baculatus TaxID=2770505 RepID=UPI0013DD1428|nr:TIGR01777 family oxidoreductase [Candidatus Laterigemmans baculatus]